MAAPPPETRFSLKVRALPDFSCCSLKRIFSYHFMEIYHHSILLSSTRRQYCYGASVSTCKGHIGKCRLCSLVVLVRGRSLLDATFQSKFLQLCRNICRYLSSRFHHHHVLIQAHLITFLPHAIPQNRSDDRKGVTSLSACQALYASAMFRRFATPRRRMFDRLEIAGFLWGSAFLALAFWGIPFFLLGGFFIRAL